MADKHGNFSSDDIQSDGEEFLPWEELRHPCFGQPIDGPFIVVRYCDFERKVSLQVRDSDNEVVAVAEISKYLNEDGTLFASEAAAKQAVGVAALLAASFSLRKAATLLIDALNQPRGEGDDSALRQKIERCTSGLMQAVSQANGYDAEMFLGISEG